MRQLVYFVAVAEELHFKKAAERLQMTQPPLSQQILLLEKELGATLLRRTKRTVELTEAGEVFLQAVKQTLLSLDNAVEEVRLLEAGKKGRFTIGFVGSATYDVLPPMIRSYREQYPNVDIQLEELSSPDQVQALLNGTIDVGVLRPPVSHEAIAAETIQRVPCVLAIPQNHRFAANDSIHLSTLVHEPFVALSRSIWPNLYDEFISMCLRSGFSPIIHQEASEFQTVLGLVAAGLGVTVVPESARYFYPHEVVYKEIRNDSLVVEMALAWRKNETSRSVQTFLALARSPLQSPQKNLSPQ